MISILVVTLAVELCLYWLHCSKQNAMRVCWPEPIYATAEELREILGEGWAICRPTPRNLERYKRCITRKQYEAAERQALQQRAIRAREERERVTV